MKQLNMTIQIDPQFTANDWQMYTCSMDCTEAANSINRVLKEAVNSGVDRYAVETLVHREMGRQAKFGAADSEPYWFLEQILNECFGNE